MDIPGAIFRLFVVTLISIVLSVFAMLSVRLAGIDLKDVRQRNNPIILAIAMFFNLLFILSVSLILKFRNNESMGVLGFNLGSRGLLFGIFVFLFSVATPTKQGSFRLQTG